MLCTQATSVIIRKISENLGSSSSKTSVTAGDEEVEGISIILNNPPTAERVSSGSLGATRLLLF